MYRGIFQKEQLKGGKFPLSDGAHPRRVNGGIPPKGEKIESFVAFTRNLIPKSRKTHHFPMKVHNLIF